MTKRKYLRELRKALGRIPEAEKEELIEYYAEIIDESYERGKTTREIFATLESPEQVASDYFNANEGRMNGRRRRPSRGENYARGREEYDDYGERPQSDDYRRAPRETAPRREKRKHNVLLTVLLFPLWFPLALVAFLLALSVSITVLALLIADILLVAAFGIAGVYTVIVSFGLLPNNAMIAVVQFGAAAVFFGLAMLFEITVKPLSKGVGAFFRLMFRRENRSSGTIAQSHWVATLAVGMIFVLVGGGVGWFGFHKLGDDWTKLADVGECVVRTEEIDVGTGVVRLQVDNLRVKVVPTVERTASLVYTENVELPLEYGSENGVVTLKSGVWTRNFWEHHKQVWQRGILYSAVISAQCEATLYLPDIYEGDLFVSVNNGYLSVDGGEQDVRWKMPMGYIDLSTDNGMISVKGLTAKCIMADSDNGYITFDHVNADQIDVTTDNGGIKLKHTQGKIVKGKTQNGVISCERLTSEDISFQVSNGSISGSIVGEYWQYSVETKVHNGSCNLKDSESGDRKLYVRVSNGSIRMEFVS